MLFISLTLRQICLLELIGMERRVTFMQLFKVGRGLSYTNLGTSIIYMVRFQVISAASVKMAVFCDVALYSMVQIYRRFTGLLLPPSGRQVFWNDRSNDGNSKHL
jgi:hypothetical protein